MGKADDLGFMREFMLVGSKNIYHWNVNNGMFLTCNNYGCSAFLTEISQPFIKWDFVAASFIQDAYFGTKAKQNSSLRCSCFSQ